jgi:drug/metabolite transporter (DMT)-like permease
MKKRVLAIIFAVLAALLYAINIPFSKLLLKDVQPTMMAAYLYLGAGLGIGVLSLFKKKATASEKEKFEKKDFPFVFGMVILDVAAPIFLMFGVKNSSSSSVSLLNNFEIVCTSLIALLIFKESISKKTWLAIILIAVSSFVLSFSDISSFKLSWGAVLVLLATLCWGLENNCTRKLANKNTFSIVIIKGIFSGLGSLIVALILRESFASLTSLVFALALGFVAYGLSIFFYVKAQGVIGAAKTSAYYSVAPFIGALLSFLIFKESLRATYFIALAIMVMGTALVVCDTLSQN